ncbi:4-hydroxyphenylacetaldehyde oxime monooxygenase-like isoform X2 [Triticum dicoccoides]|uniref:4-hydroxyphenylacetaldehyde oxime monooxygenase-like isoform X2 n=1 Tax=Triticum dicoccoides TaxID=85692 RepID=UPI00188FFD52|nr:4-hydroxyphenylacetaldehyde oxime monooxygenase-like isoform X2 [Triticum dicoccoides]
MAISLLVQLPQPWHFLLLLAGLLLAVVSYLLVTRRDPEERGLRLPPGPSGVPVLGNLHQLGPLPHRSLRDLAGRHGPVMLLRLGAARAVVVSSASAARDVMRAHDADCCSRPASPGPARLSYGRKSVAFSPYGAYWRDMRRLLAAELVGARGVSAAWAARREQVDRLMSALRNAVVPVALDEHVFRVADGIIGTVAYGSVYGAEAFARKYERFQHVLFEATDMSASFSAEDFFPNAAGRLVDRLVGVVARRERIFRDLDGFFEEMLEHHQDPARPKPESGSGDLVDALVGLCEKHGFATEHVKAVLVDAFLGGIDTSSVTILWAMSELMRKPRALKTAQEEIRAAVGGNGNGNRVQPDDLPKLAYLKMVVKETLRLHPPATLLLPRETLRRVEIGGYEVPAGTRVLVNAWAVGREPASWGPDAEEFEPERFEAGGRHGKVDFRGAHMELVPFGAGRRICPGLAMGVANVEYTLANMLCGFEWAVPEGEEVSMEEAGALNFHRKTPLVLVPTPYAPPACIW